jgi:hypothetical protein
VLLAVLLGIFGCNDPKPMPTCSINGAPEVTLGTGPEDGMGFVPVTDGEMVPLTFGVQQGFHVWVNIRAKNVCFSQIKVTRTARLTSTQEIIITSSDQLTLIPASDPALAADGVGELPTSRPTFMCPNTLSLSIPGQSVDFRVDIQDSGGRMASDQRRLVPVCPANSFHDRCVSQCLAETADGGV